MLNLVIPSVCRKAYLNLIAPCRSTVSAASPLQVQVWTKRCCRSNTKRPAPKASKSRQTPSPCVISRFKTRKAMPSNSKTCTGVTLIQLKTTWSDGPDESNGGYGLYPVACKNVLIDSCEASFASDAGIYVGQSQDVIVRNCYAYGNVAGIEIEKLYPFGGVRQPLGRQYRRHFDI
jgi:hypothetical protein